MNNNLHNKENIKAYLLGKLSDEKTLAAIEESLFLDDEFTAEIELVEDEIINDYVLGNLSAEDRESAENSFFKTSERQFKLKLTRELKEKTETAKKTGEAEKSGLFETLKNFFRQPAYAGAFAVLLVAAIGVSIYLFRSSSPTELAGLQTIYQKERPVQTRISGFGYAPLNTVRGENENQENKNKLRRIENDLLEAVEKNPSAENHRALGVFKLTQRKFADAISELEKAAALDGKNAKIANDLGSAYFESAQSKPSEKTFELYKALENFSRAGALDANLLEALFNKSLCLQELKLYNEAKEAWQKYLEKDSNSGWADEARRNLQSLENLKTTSKTKEQVFDDFFAAYRRDDKEFAWKINRQTKEMIEEVWLPDQLTRRYLETRQQENIDALKFIGELERDRNADFFVIELAAYYSKIDASQTENLQAAKNSMSAGYKASKASETAQAIRFFENAAKLFSAAGDELEAKTAEFWAAQVKRDERKVAESLAILNPLAKYFDEKKYRWLYSQAIYWIAQNYFFQSEFTKIIRLCKEAFDISDEISDSYGKQKNISCLADNYSWIGELNQSLRFLAQLPDPKDLYYASPLQNWRNYYYSAKLFDRLEMFSTAESFGMESLSLGKKFLDPNGTQVNSSLEILAKINMGKQRFEEGLSFADESKTLAQNQPEGTIKQSLLAKATLQIADLKRRMNRCGEALNDYDAVIKLYAQFSEISLNDFAVHKGKLLCYQALNQENDLQAELETVLNLSEKYRSRILKDDERQAFFDNEQIVYDVAVESALAKGDEAKAFEFAENSKARSLLDFVNRKTAEEQISEVSKPLSLTEIQARMPENVQIVEFGVLREKSVIWILTKTEVKTFKIDVSEADLENKILDYLNLITQKSGKTEIEKSGKELYALLVKQILPALDASKEICLIPDKSLHRLPFAALISESGKFLPEDFGIFSSPSASIFVFATERARELEKLKDENLLSVGNPAFDAEENANLSSLPSAEDEARTIAKFYPNTKQFLGADATKANFLDALPNAEIVHFAGHYVANAESPGYSKLLFSSGSQDGDLRSFEIIGKKLPKSKLVVLSACETGIEKFYKGEGAVGIARTFLSAGTPVVLASAWKVDSEATKDLMIAFHRNRREKGLTSVEALRRAQIEMLKDANENFRQPYFWTAFSIIGGSANY